MKKIVTTTSETTITLTKEELEEAVKEYLLQRSDRGNTNTILDSTIRFDIDRHGEEVTGVTLISRDSDQREEEV